jgi:Ca2+-binding EF-hand superfamily protein
MSKFAGVFVVIAFSAVAALAQDLPPPPPPGAGPGGGQMMRFQMPSFAELDKNKDKKLSADEVPFPPNIFERLDENKDGFVDEEEFNRSRQRFMGGGGGGPRLGDTLGKLLDANRDSKISREEFARINQVFDALDRDRNGELTQEELNRFFEGVREASNQATGGVEVAALFEKFDKNKDGKIMADEMTSEREFKALDLNKDGAITREEADEALKKLAERARQKSATPQPKN